MYQGYEEIDTRLEAFNAALPDGEDRQDAILLAKAARLAMREKIDATNRQQQPDVDAMTIMTKISAEFRSALARLYMNSGRQFNQDFLARLNPLFVMMDAYAHQCQVALHDDARIVAALEKGVQVVL